RDGVRSGQITCSVRIWMYPRVKPGHRYRMEEGEIEVDAVEPITIDDITDDMARASGFASVADLLKVAKHGRGENVYLVRFHYAPPMSRRGR
ncbi:MAG TPA: ASCH domain-containing protein, partial [Thermoanaerobaculia bacterium]|nr:ASCH domain-containing protein [Thermoanaerobaculia bacterium]